MNALITALAAVALSQVTFFASPTSAQEPAASSSAVSSAPVSAAPIANWDVNAPYDTDIVIGDPKAPVTIIEYGSLTCPHCAAFQTKKFPELKEEWIDTGKVRIVFRHFPIDQAAMGAAALVSCLPATEQHAAIDVLYKDVNVWATKPLQESIPEVLSKAFGRELTFKADFEACIQKPEYAQSVLRSAYDASKQGVSATPHFYVNGESVVGYSETQPRQIDDMIVKKLGEAKIKK